MPNLHCERCQKSTPQAVVQGRRRKAEPGKDTTAYGYYPVTHTCKECGNVTKSKLYPDLLADVFSV